MQKTIESYDVKKNLAVKKTGVSTALILISVIPGAFLSHFSAGLVNIALTDISLDFHVSLSLTQWIVTGYLLTVMIFLPIMGKLSDRFGRKNIHNAGYFLFGVGVLFSYFSPSLILLIIARIIQGIGAAMLQSVNMAIITNSVPKEKRVKALGLVGTAVGIGGLLGAPVGGLLINWFSWHTLFLIQLPVVLIVLVLAICYIPKDKKENLSKGKFDALGAILFSFSITSFMYVLNQIGEGVFNSLQIIILFSGILSLIFFIRWVKNKDEPFINLAIFKQPVVRVGALITVASYAACFATIVVLPFYFRGILQTTVTISGLMLMIYPLFLSVFGPISGRVVNNIGSSKAVKVALLIMCSAFLMLVTISPTTHLVIIAILLALLGIAMGLLTSPNYNLIIENVPDSSIGEISGAIALLRNLGMVLGTAFAITILNFIAIPPLTEWLDLDLHQDKLSILRGIKYIFIAFSFLIFSLFLKMFYVKKENLEYTEMRSE